MTTPMIRMRRRAVWVVPVFGALVAAGCASSSNSTAGSPPLINRNGAGAGGTLTTGGALIGWDCPGGVCDWSGGAGSAPASNSNDDVIRAASVPTARSAPGTAPATTTGAPVTTRAPTGPQSTTSTGPAPISSGPTSYANDQAVAGANLPPVDGTIDDNRSWDAYLQYRRAYLALGLPSEEIPVERRQVIQVVDTTGRPVIGADVNVQDPLGTIVAHLVTRADGRVLFHPGSPPNMPYVARVTREGASAEVALDPATTEFTVNLGPVVLPPHPKVDVLFLIDGTASMADEVARLKDNIDTMTADITGSYTDPDVRFGLTVYRDRDPHELFDTRTFGFTADPAQFSAAVHQVEAAGGNDTPEDLAGGLHAALTKPGWRGDDTVKLLVLVTDAPPHLGAANAVSYTQDAADANALGVKILAVGATGLDLEGEFLYRQLAQVTAGRFVFLTGGADGATPPRPTRPVKPDATSALPLDAVVTKLVTGEILAAGR